MKTCKECIHYERCVEIYEASGFVFDYERSCCTKFSDYFEWVRLRCKVGDTVYVPYEDSQTIEEKRVKLMSFEMDEIETHMKFYCRHNYTFLYTDIDIKVFLTREDAEKALKERDGS